MAVEFKDHIVLVEAPQNEATTTPILAEAKKVIPNKPIKYVINTHTHSDHSGGMRTAVADGAIILDYNATDASPNGAIRDAIISGRGGTGFQQA